MGDRKAVGNPHMTYVHAHRTSLNLKAERDPVESSPKLLVVRYGHRLVVVYDLVHIEVDVLLLAVAISSVVVLSAEPLPPTVQEERLLAEVERQREAVRLPAIRRGLASKAGRTRERRHVANFGVASAALPRPFLAFQAELEEELRVVVEQSRTLAPLLRLASHSCRLRGSAVMLFSMRLERIDVLDRSNFLPETLRRPSASPASSRQKTESSNDLYAWQGAGPEARGRDRER